MGGGSYKSYLMEHLARMHTDIEGTTRKLELEQRRLYNLDKMLHMAEGEWSIKRERYKKLQEVVDSGVEKKADNVRVLERNLVKAIEDLNKGNCDNEQLREQIDQLRKERTILDSVFKTMEKDINSNKKLMEKEIAKINDSQYSCQEAKQKTRALNKMLDRERRGFKEETKKMREYLHYQIELQKEQDNPDRPNKIQAYEWTAAGITEVTAAGKHFEYGSPKAGDTVTEIQKNLLKALKGTIEKALKDATIKVGSMAKGKNRKAYMVADEEEAFSETLMHRRILKLSFLNTIQRRHIKQHQKNIEVFEQAFATIKSSTGISDIEEIVKIFIGLEQRNFSLLTYVNELNRDIETIEIRNRELQNNLNTYHQDQKGSAVRKDEALSELCVQIQKTKAATEEKDKMIEDSASALVECRPLVWNIVSQLKQQLPDLIQKGYEGDPPAMKMATPDEHEENLNNYLMYIEDAILQFRVSLTQDAQHMANLRPQPPRVPPQRTQKPSELPSAHITGDDSDDDPDTGLGDRPWTRNELRDRAQAMIQRRKRKQHGKLMGEDKQRTDTVDDSPAVDPARGAPPAKEADGGGTSLSKSPSMSTKTEPVEGARADEEGNRGDRPENWWRGQGKEKGR